MMQTGLAVAALAIIPALAVADTITVDDDGPADYDTIQAAIDAAKSGDEVLVSQLESVGMDSSCL